MTPGPVLPDPNLPGFLKQRFLPYPPHSLAARIHLEVVGLTVDGHDLIGQGVRVDRNRIRPHAIGDWQSLRVVLRAKDPTEEISGLAFGQDAQTPLRTVLRIRCPATRLRGAVPMVPDGDHVIAELTLAREDVDASVYLEAAVCRGDYDAEATGTRAAEVGLWLARSPRWVLEAEEPTFPSGGALETAWVDFANPEPQEPYRLEDRDQLQCCPQAISHVVFRPSGPLVLINKTHPEIMDMLGTKGTIGPRARLRDFVFGRIGAATWRSILSRVVDELDFPFEASVEEMEWADLGETHWTHPILKHACKVLKTDRETLLAEMSRSHDYEGYLFMAAETLGRVGTETLRKLVKEMENL